MAPLRNHAVLLAVGALALGGCSFAAGERAPAWVLPFGPEAGGCATISTPFSVANPWDHAHEALDFACLPGAAVFAVTEGEIDSVGRVVVRGEGRFRVWLAVEGAPLRVEYANLASASVSPGDAVSPGEPIGESALGLHLAIWSEDEGRYVDPGDYLPLESMADAP